MISHKELQGVEPFVIQYKQSGDKPLGLLVAAADVFYASEKGQPGFTLPDKVVKAVGMIIKPLSNRSEVDQLGDDNKAFGQLCRLLLGLEPNDCYDFNCEQTLFAVSVVHILAHSLFAAIPKQTSDMKSDITHRIFEVQLGERKTLWGKHLKNAQHMAVKYGV